MKPFFSLLLAISLLLSLSDKHEAQPKAPASGLRARSQAQASNPLPAADPTVIAAGDIVDCPNTAGSEATAKLLDKIPGTILPIGDLAYPDGSDASFRCYDKTWGRHKDRTRPAPGNHEYHTAGAAGYFRYFGKAAGDPARGYYSFDLGSWHIIALNSQCSAIGGCGKGSPQETMAAPGSSEERRELHAGVLARTAVQLGR